MYAHFVQNCFVRAINSYTFENLSTVYHLAVWYILPLAELYSFYYCDYLVRITVELSVRCVPFVWSLGCVLLLFSISFLYQPIFVSASFPIYYSFSWRLKCTIFIFCMRVSCHEVWSFSVFPYSYFDKVSVVCCLNNRPDKEWINFVIYCYRP